MSAHAPARTEADIARDEERAADGERRRFLAMHPMGTIFVRRGAEWVVWRQ